MEQRSNKRGLGTLQQALQGFLAESGLNSKLEYHSILGAWNRAVGEKLAQRARAVRFRGGDLLVEVQSAAHLQELSNFTGEEYRRKANEILGVERIRRVTFQLTR